MVSHFDLVSNQLCNILKKPRSTEEVGDHSARIQHSVGANYFTFFQSFDETFERFNPSLSFRWGLRGPRWVMITVIEDCVLPIKRQCGARMVGSFSHQCATRLACWSMSLPCPRASTMWETVTLEGILIQKGTERH